MGDVVQCYAYLNARIQPLLRGKMFEDPLMETMTEKGIGNVAGGGTLQDKTGEIIHCGIDLDLDLTDPNVEFVCDFLTRRCAPKGSKLMFQRGGEKVEIPFGRIEGIAVYLNGTDLPAEVYQTSDVNVVMETFYKLTDRMCSMRGYWRGPRETALYMYGLSAAQLESKVAPFMAEYPLCEKARVVRIA